jgi:hypothetical protein
MPARSGRHHSATRIGKDLMKILLQPVAMQAIFEKRPSPVESSGQICEARFIRSHALPRSDP